MRYVLYFLTPVALLFGKLAYAEMPAKAISEKMIKKTLFSLSSEKKKKHERLIDLLKKSGKTKELEKLIELEKIKKIKFVYQHTARGDGDAILCAYDLIKNEEAFAVLFDFIKKRQACFFPEINFYAFCNEGLIKSF